MPAPVDVRGDYSPEQLREISASLPDQNHARRLLAIAAILEGVNRTDAARIGGMERQTLRDWVHRFNSHGPEGLKNLRSPGRPPKLDPSQQAELAEVIAAGPDPASGSGRWRLADLVDVIRERFDVNHDAVSVGRIMRRLGYRYNGTEWQHTGANEAEDRSDDKSSCQCAANDATSRSGG